jgi:hypothetical protein
LAFETHCTKYRYQKATEAGFRNITRFNIEQWLHEKPKIRILGKNFSVSASIAMHELKNLLPKLIVAMQGSISWPHRNLPSWISAIGCIDYIAYLRTSIHPRQAEWYRRDKGSGETLSLLIFRIQHVGER